MTKTLPILLLFVVGCSSDDGPVTDPGNNGLDDPFNETTGLELAEQDFGPDPYSIGRDWYIYGGASRALFPEPWVYVLRGKDQISMFEIDSYYNDVGDSGFFTLTTKRFDGETWSESESFISDKNVKEENVCLSLSPPEEVDCEDATIVLRTAWRAIPQGGFSVLEPALFHRAHYTFEDPRSVSVVETDLIADVTEDETELRELADVPSSATDPRHSRVGWLHDKAGDPPTSDIQLQITSNLHISQWKVDAIQVGDESVSIDLRALCQRTSTQEQQPFPAGDGDRFTIDLDTTNSYSGALVQICDSDADSVVSGVVVETFTKAQVGLWPDTKTFDLIVEQLDGRVAIRIAPGHLLWNWTRGSVDGTDEFSPISIDSVWEEKLGG